ncbi:retinal guanylyl cyclase 2-like, partial [Oxyura jamaicensis]|uniref:retinal guanylyl cyclase 2-like n=1 Tax=Oxyura jamaicensis TaxID=8884 RepID=UPI0015A56AC3
MEEAGEEERMQMEVDGWKMQLVGLDGEDPRMCHLEVGPGAPLGAVPPPWFTHPPHAVVVMCMHSVLLGGEEQRVLLEKAEDMGMTDGTYVFIPYDALTFPLPYHHVPYPILANSTKLRLAYDAVLTITIDSPDVSFHEALRQAQEAYEIPAHIDPTQVHPLFATIYNSIYFLANAVEATRRTGRWVMGTSVAEHARGFQLEGFCQPFSVTEDGDVSVPYVVLDTDGKGDRLWPVYGLEPGTRGLGYRGHSVHWPHGSSPGTDSGCWFESGSICNGGEWGAPAPRCVRLSGWARVGPLVSLSELSWSTSWEAWCVSICPSGLPSSACPSLCPSSIPSLHPAPHPS